MKVDRLGRRILLLCSSAGVSISLALMGTFFYLQHLELGTDTVSISWMPLLSLVLFFISYSVGFASVPFILMGELFPSRYRALCSSIASSAPSSWCCTLASMPFVYFFLSETKGRTLDQIEAIFRTKTRLQTDSLDVAVTIV